MKPEDVKVVGVIGCGLMGSGIVEVCARADIDVTYVEATDDLVGGGRKRIEKSVGKAVERGKLAGEDGEAALAPSPPRRSLPAGSAHPPAPAPPTWSCGWPR
jgi:3-hydroxyacyl-CoA dehydrogenase